MILHDTTEFSFKREDIGPIGMLNKGVAGLRITKDACGITPAVAC
jgi:hypothetical protein